MQRILTRTGTRFITITQASIFPKIKRVTREFNLQLLIFYFGYK